MFLKRKRSFQHELERVYEDGQILVREGESGRDMYVVQEGEVLITKKVGDRELILATLGKGEFFGEMSLLNSQPRSATARAVGQIKVLVIQSGGFLLKIRRDPTFAFEMLQKLSGRLRVLDEKLITALEGEGVTVDQLNRIVLEAEFGAGRGHGHGD